MNHCCIFIPNQFFMVQVLPEGGALPPVRFCPTASIFEYLHSDCQGLGSRSSEGSGNDVSRIVDKMRAIQRKKIRKEYIVELVRSYETRLVVLEEELSRRCFESLSHKVLTREVCCRRGHSERCESTIRALQQKVWTLENIGSSKEKEQKEDKEKEKLKNALNNSHKTEHTLTAQVEGLTNDIEDFEKQISLLHIDLENTTNQLSEQITLITSLEGDCSTAQQATEDIKNEFSEATSSWQATESNLKKKNDEITSEKKQCEESLQNLRDDFKTFSEGNCKAIELEYECQIRDLEESKKTVEDSYYQLQTGYDSVIVKYDSLYDDHISLQSEINSLKSISTEVDDAYKKFRILIQIIQQPLKIIPCDSNSLENELHLVKDGISKYISLTENITETLNKGASELEETKVVLLKQQQLLHDETAKLLVAEQQCDLYVSEIEKLNSSNPYVAAAKEKVKKRNDEMKELAKKLHVAPEVPRAFRLLLARMENSVKKVNEKLVSKTKTVRNQQKETFMEQTTAADTAGMVTSIAQPVAPAKAKFQNAALQLLLKKPKPEGTADQPASPTAQEPSSVLRNIFMRAADKPKIKKVDPIDSLSDAMKKMKSNILFSEGNLPTEMVSTTMKLLSDNISKTAACQAVKDWLIINSPNQLEPPASKTSPVSSVTAGREIEKSTPEFQLPSVRNVSNQSVPTSSSLATVVKLRQAASRTTQKNKSSKSTLKMNIRDYATELLGPRIGNKGFR